MKRFSGLTVGLGLLTVGTFGGVAFAATQGTVAPSTPVERVTNHGGRMIRGTGNGSYGRMGNTHTIMGAVGSPVNRMMMGAASGSVWTPAHVAALVRQSEQHVTIDRATNTITYHGTQDLLVPLAAPAALHLKGMQWEIDGLINPTVVIPHGARVTVDLVNADQGYMHGFEVTKGVPPFQEMAMRQGTVAFSGSFIRPILPETTQGQFHRSTHFIATIAGTYYYICPVPGHAAHGMAGRFVVS